MCYVAWYIAHYVVCMLYSIFTHVTDLWVARLRVWDQFRSMLAVNSTLLSDDLGLQHFYAQEWKRSTHWQLGLAKGSCTCILRKMQKDRSLVPLEIVKILSKFVKQVGFEPLITQSRLLNVPTRPFRLFEMKCNLCTEYIFTKNLNCTLLAGNLRGDKTVSRTPY